MNKYLLVLFIAIGLVTAGFGQAKNQKDEDYRQAINLRSEKIVSTLSIAKEEKSSAVVAIISQQYFDLNEIHTKRNNALNDLKKDSTISKETRARKQEAIQQSSNKRLAKLHKKFLRKLSTELSEEQVTQVKNGMTYNVLPITYKAYQDMIPALTDLQKAQILAWLTEAREHAMDAGTSDEKHAWFGKYKGRINNYLSAQGYDSKKEREEWEKRIKAGKGT